MRFTRSAVFLLLFLLAAGCAVNPPVNRFPSNYLTYLNGIKQKTATYEENYNNSIDKYEYNNYGIKEKINTYERNYNGGVDIYQYNNYGLKEKTGTIEKH